MSGHYADFVESLPVDSELIRHRFPSSGAVDDSQFTQFRDGPSDRPDIDPTAFGGKLLLRHPARSTVVTRVPENGDKHELLPRWQIGTHKLSEPHPESRRLFGDSSCIMRLFRHNDCP